MPTMERILISSSANVMGYSSDDDDSDSDDEIGRMVYNCSETAKKLDQRRRQQTILHHHPIQRPLLV